MPDSEDIHLKQLSQVQIRFIRNMLNLHPRSMIAPLFTGTGIIPLRVRRLLVLTHLVHGLGLVKKHYARAALDSSIELSAQGKKMLGQGLDYRCFTTAIPMSRASCKCDFYHRRHTELY